MRTVMLAIVLAAFSFQANAESEREALIEAFATLSPSVGALYALESGGDLRFLCSATAVDRVGDKTVILTAYHCLKKGVSYLINFGDNTLRPLAVWKIPHYEVDAEKYPRRFNEPKTDMALFVMNGVDVPIVALAGDGFKPYGAKIAMVGFPLGLSKIMYEGIVAGKFDRPGDDMAGYTLLQIFGAPGSSGSSVVDVETGAIIGVLVAGTAGNSGLPVIFATPIDYRRYLSDVLPEGEYGEVGEGSAAAPTSP